MSLLEKINSDLKSFFKAGQSFEVGILRMIVAAIHNKEIEKRGKGKEPELTEEELIDLLSKENKKRKESAELYKQGNRNDLVEKELKESEFIQKYLPEAASEEEIGKIVSEAIAKTGAKDIKDMGKAMGEAMKWLKGRADASVIGNLIKKKLGI